MAAKGVKDFKVAHSLREQVSRLEAELAKAQRESADSAAIKQIIGGMSQTLETLQPPKWTTSAGVKASTPGVPTLFLSDLHWGEVVHPSQINGVNKYNLKVAQDRLKYTVETAINLLRIIDSEMNYPGIVLPLGGDMISGDIHDELKASNDLPSIPTVFDLFEHLVGAIGVLADTFGAVFLPCVTGNHGRNTHKIYAKDRHHTSFDWMLYRFLAKHFEKDSRITFFIPDGNDALYRIFDTRYLLTHGDLLGKGGDGLIGALGPILRGDHKKRARNAQIDLEYDVMILGHWHQYSHMTRVVVNGSLKGLDEYAYVNNFGFEVPQQAMWITHPRHGVTFRMPVYSEAASKPQKAAWVSHVGGSVAELRGAGRL